MGLEPKLSATRQSPECPFSEERRKLPAPVFPELGPELGPKSSCFSGPDLDFSFQPMHASKVKGRLTGVDDNIVAMYACGMTSSREVWGRQLRPLPESLSIKLRVASQSP
jgi:hypothetical protein